MKDKYLLEEDVSLDAAILADVDEEYEIRALEAWASNPDIHPNLRNLSHSTLSLLQSCARKFELSKLFSSSLNSFQPAKEDDEGGHFNFGTVVGNGIQEYLISNSLDRAIFRAFLDWKGYLDDSAGEKSSKTFWHAVRAIEKFVSFRHDELAAYDLVFFEEKPAVELGFSIDFGHGFHYRGKLDALLIHRVRKNLLVLECKTTGVWVPHEAMYKNSGQGTGYGVVIDRIAHDMKLSNEYEVLYPIYLTRSMNWQEFRFHKSPVKRATWIQDVLIRVGHIEQYEQLDYYPPNGNACFAFNKPCAFFDLCMMGNHHLFPGGKDLVKVKFDKVEDYPFKFSVDELIEAQVAGEK